MKQFYYFIFKRDPYSEHIWNAYRIFIFCQMNFFIELMASCIIYNFFRVSKYSGKILSESNCNVLAALIASHQE